VLKLHPKIQWPIFVVPIWTTTIGKTIGEYSSFSDTLMSTIHWLNHWWLDQFYSPYADDLTIFNLLKNLDLWCLCFLMAMTNCWCSSYTRFHRPAPAPWVPTTWRVRAGPADTWDGRGRGKRMASPGKDTGISWNIFWLVVSTPVKNISQWEGLSHMLWKIKHVPNHQPVSWYTFHSQSGVGPAIFDLSACLKSDDSDVLHDFRSQHLGMGET